MNYQTPFQVFHRAQYVQWVSPDDSEFAVWYGGLTINIYYEIYHGRFREYDRFTLGHADAKDVTLEDVKQAIEGYFTHDLGIL